jgi:hypothetical protein
MWHISFDELSKQLASESKIADPGFLMIMYKNMLNYTAYQKRQILNIIRPHLTIDKLRQTLALQPEKDQEDILNMLGKIQSQCQEKTMFKLSTLQQLAELTKVLSSKIKLKSIIDLIGEFPLTSVVLKELGNKSPEERKKAINKMTVDHQTATLIDSIIFVLTNHYYQNRLGGAGKRVARFMGSNKIEEESRSAMVRFVECLKEQNDLQESDKILLSQNGHFNDHVFSVYQACIENINKDKADITVNNGFRDRMFAMAPSDALNVNVVGNKQFSENMYRVIV